MSFIPHILQFFNVIPSNISKRLSPSENRALATQTKTTSIVLFILRYLKISPPSETPRKTTITFYGWVKQILIPTREEYYKAYGTGENSNKLVGDMLWYTQGEKKGFLTEGIAEVTAFAGGATDFVSLQKAKNTLYRLGLENNVTNSTWENSQVTELSLKIFKTFRKRHVDLNQINIKTPDQKTSETPS